MVAAVALILWDLGVCNPALIYPVARRAGVELGQAAATVIDESCPKAPASKSRRCLNQGPEAWEAVTPPPADRTALKSTNGRP
jgi:hypothetical protein